MNPISPELTRGAVGELLVQLRLLQFDVQAAPPVKDSGNDLIAIRRNVFRAIQVKTTGGMKYSVQGLPEYYHLLAVVQLVGSGTQLHLDRSRIFFLPKDRVDSLSRRIDKIQEFELSQGYVDHLFS